MIKSLNYFEWLKFLLTCMKINLLTLGLNQFWNIDVSIKFLYYSQSFPAGIYFFKINNGKTRIMCKIYSKLTIEIPERSHWYRSDVVIVNFEQNLHIVWCFNARIKGWSPVSDRTKMSHDLFKAPTASHSHSKCCNTVVMTLIVL